MKHMRHLRIAGSALLTALFLTVLLCGGIVFAASDTSGTTKISLVAKEVKQGNNTNISVSARLVDAGHLVGNEPVEFDVAANFFGDQQVNLGTVMTDATGTASIIYEPRWQGIHVFTAHFRGDSKYPHVEVTSNINFSGPILTYLSESIGLLPIRQWITPLVGLGVVIFWALLIFVAVYILSGISRARNQVGTTPEPGTPNGKLNKAVSQWRRREIK